MEIYCKTGVYISKCFLKLTAKKTRKYVTRDDMKLGPESAVQLEGFYLRFC